AACDNRIDPIGIDIDTGHGESRFTERQRKRQADVTETDYAKSGLFRPYAIFKFAIRVGFDSSIVFNDCAHVFMVSNPFSVGPTGRIASVRLRPFFLPAGPPTPTRRAHPTPTPIPP